MTSIEAYTVRATTTIAERIENSLGGNVEIVNDKKEETLTLDWKKNDKTVHMVQFKKVYSYKELEAFSDPGAIVMDFISAFTKREKVEPAKVEKVRVAKVAKVEEPKVEKVEKVEEPKVAKTESKK